MGPKELENKLFIETNTTVSAARLRHWEMGGLLGEVPKTETGRRNYDQNHYDKIKVICKLKALGYPLSAVARLLKGDNTLVFEVAKKSKLYNAVVADLKELSQNNL